MGKTAAEELEITEFEEMSVELVNGVKEPANGTTHLLLKGLGDAVAAIDAEGKEAGTSSADDTPRPLLTLAKAVVDGKLDQAPDIALGQQIMHLLGQAIINEAQEVSAGQSDETWDVELLNSIAQSVQRWMCREQDGADRTDGVVINSVWSYPLEGDDDSKAGKSAEVAPEGADVDTTQQGSDTQADMAKAVADAVTEATRPVLDRLAAKETELDGLLAKVKATPVPGGPVLSAAALGQRPAQADAEDWAAKAAAYADKAEIAADPVLAAGYRKLASQAAEKAGITAP